MYKVWRVAYDVNASKSASLSRHTGDGGLVEEGLSSQGFSGQDALEKALNWLPTVGERIVGTLPHPGPGVYAYVITELVV